MSGGPQIVILKDPLRIHLHHGPIDIIARAWGSDGEIRLAYQFAAHRFESVLDELVSELTELRSPIGVDKPVFDGLIAQRMGQAVWPNRTVFVTPMAAVAGAVADEILAAMIGVDTLEKAMVNNGGDVALFLSPGSHLSSAIVANLDNPAVDAKLIIDSRSSVRGIATSGWRGRSLSFGVADAVTVLAETAAEADVAATLIANAVTVDDPSVERAPAQEVRDDTDLGERLVTVAVGQLSETAVTQALESGARTARRMIHNGHAEAAYLSVQGRVRIIDESPVLVK